MMTMIRAAFFALILALAAPAYAETDFPNKPVTIVVPFAAGGPSDAVTRILADELAKIWKQQVVIENRGGGGTVIGTALVGNSRPDGYTIIMVSGSFVINAAVRTSLPYDTLKDFAGVAIFVEAPLAIVSHPGFGPSTLVELIAEAKKRTDKPLVYASPGIGSPAHMAGELIQKKGAVKLVHISYGGEAASMSDVLSGRVDFQIGTWANQRPHVESGKLKLISVLYGTRLPEAPNTATATESIADLGLPLSATSFIVAPAKVPRDVIAKIGADIRTVTASKVFQDKILALGSFPRYATPEETDAFIRKEIGVWTEIAKAANIRLD